MSPRKEVVGASDVGGGDRGHRIEATNPAAIVGDSALESAIRPRSLEEFIGQPDLKGHLDVVIQAAIQRGESVDHILFAGPPGLGKTSLAQIVANEMGAGFRVASGPTLVRGGDLAAILNSLNKGDVLFIDEIHRMSKSAGEVLYPAMEDFKLDILIGEGPTARSIRLDLAPFTLIGATTRTGMLTGPLRDRFGFVAHLGYYEVPELTKIVQRSSGVMNLKITGDASIEIARRSRGTPRLANRLLRRVRDFAQVNEAEMIDMETARRALSFFGADEMGLDKIDRTILETMCIRYGGRPIGITTIAATIGEDAETIEDVYEPFLLQSGLISRTPRGRVPTALAYQHIGLDRPADSGDLFG
ncbi:Holliday junction branch migration DNA helicase RuvB [Acidithrix ferrooxidans]|uniref:Holliday junction branch migration complex subunit RuvB n=2 Tax=root TaxID=1 RepID=A0A0D8HJB9_9ACTN|nr:Holliday junction branch migration DNA helicase RuvB [Acidithrix ferrooxidans]KJF18070.1 holliday junction ATP-dependent DNA helicase RuvB [Acidithrix ferrooxidans]